MARASKLLVFDWDDTILPFSFVNKLQAKNRNALPRQYRRLFREVEKCAEACLSAAAQHGEVLIITNSDEGWVRHSCGRWLPNLLPLLQRSRVVSARTEYASFYPAQPLCWKAAAFAHAADERFRRTEFAPAFPGCDARGTSPDVNVVSTDELEDGPLSPAEGDAMPWGVLADAAPASPRWEIVSFGDALEERTAVKIVAHQLGATPKSVKFLRDPTPAQVVGQLALLAHHMRHVCEHEEGLDMEISRKQAESCAHSYLARRGLDGEGFIITSPSVFRRVTQTAPCHNEEPACNMDAERDDH